MQSQSHTQGKLDILDKKILYGLFSKNPQRLIDRENEEELLDDKPSH
jgi:hypothetical protein